MMIQNFGVFYGEHRIDLDTGIIFMVGDRGFRASFCDALSYAYYGALGHGDYSGLVNHRHAVEAVEKGGWNGCSVSLQIRDGDKGYVVKRSFSLFMDDAVRERLTYSMKLPDARAYWEYICVDNLSTLGTGLSRGGETLLSLEHVTEMNRIHGIGFLFLVDALTCLTDEHYQQALESLAKSRLEQIMILQGGLRKTHGSRVIRLGETIESITFRVKDFPFQPEALLRDIDVLIYNKYVTQGEVYQREVYGHVYTLEAVEVYPSGAMYRRDASKIMIA
jgi:hypothetical protein